jgi:hypothetical protein
MQLDAIDLSDWQKVIERIAKDMHEGKLKPGQLDETLVKNTFSELKAGAASGYGKEWAKFGDDAGQDSTAPAAQLVPLFRC